MVRGSRVVVFLTLFSIFSSKYRARPRSRVASQGGQDQDICEMVTIEKNIDRSECVADQYEIIMGQNSLWLKLNHIQRLAWLNY
jgi:hypothetical protein